MNTSMFKGRKSKKAIVAQETKILTPAEKIGLATIEMQ